MEAGHAPERRDDRHVDPAGADRRVAEVDDSVAGRRRARRARPRAATVLPAPTSPVISPIGGFLDAPGDPGDGLGVAGVAVQHRRGEVLGEGRPGKAPVGTQSSMRHRPSSSIGRSVARSRRTARSCDRPLGARPRAARRRRSFVRARLGAGGRRDRDSRSRSARPAASGPRLGRGRLGVRGGRSRAPPPRPWLCPQADLDVGQIEGVLCRPADYVTGTALALVGGPRCWLAAHNFGAWWTSSQAVEKRDQSVRRSVAAGSNGWRSRLGQRSFFDRHVGVDVGPHGGLKLLVSEP